MDAPSNEQKQVNSDLGSSVIPVRSERQAMDWSLVLASQDIQAVIERSPENRWVLIVEPRDYGRAVRTIRQYHLENRGWAWQQHLPWSDVTFHWGAVIWCSLLALVHRLATIEFPAFHNAARVDSVSVWAGQWWRLFTAVLLHGDIAHLLANVTTGSLLLGLAMARFGAALALTAAYFAGVAGNLAGLLIYRGPYQGLGASGMVMAGLGLISIHSIAAWRANGDSSKQWLRAAFSGIMLFVVLGMNPSTDVVAHLGGFVFGALFGAALMRVPPPLRDSRAVQAACWSALAGTLLLTIALAL